MYESLLTEAPSSSQRAQGNKRLIVISLTMGLNIEINRDIKAPDRTSLDFLLLAYSF